MWSRVQSFAHKLTSRPVIDKNSDVSDNISNVRDDDNNDNKDVSDGDTVDAGNNDNNTYHSEVHNRTISLVSFSEYLQEKIPLDAVKKLKVDYDETKVETHISKNIATLELIAAGNLDLWDMSDIKTKLHGIATLTTYGPLPSNQQGSKHGVKHHNLACLNQPEEEAASIWMIAMGLLKEISK